ncbi:hypothetical protein QJS10_CPB17g01514 [Acorus calamus]|uniref:Uncharacterized protein n=1 Tax=Acorus calamus TaxID=4465 RepID=A0AAV9CRU8_ACOCL|nr:hypothetical protein QJS10_CPB17g01514 [Acorus calamus]
MQSPKQGHPFPPLRWTTTKEELLGCRHFDHRHRRRSRHARPPLRHHPLRPPPIHGGDHPLLGLRSLLHCPHRRAHLRRHGRGWPLRGQLHRPRNEGSRRQCRRRCRCRLRMPQLLSPRRLRRRHRLHRRPTLPVDEPRVGARGVSPHRRGCDWVFPFKAIDAVNRSLCALMLFSISALIAVGLSVGRRSLLGSFTHATWSVDAILPAVPVTVLTLGFHVITPFVCKIVGHTVFDARRAILVGGAVPLAMVLAWNAVVLGLARLQPDLNSVGCADPIRLLLSVNSSALPAVQGFAFTALATSLIGYAVSLPKQVSDTVGLVSAITGSGLSVGLASEGGRVGFVVFSEGKRSGSLGWASFNSSRSKCVVSHDTSLRESGGGGILMCVVLGSAVLIVSFFPMAFSVALDFAGVYANCFLFGVLPPVMAWIHRSRRPSNSVEVDILPGGRVALLLLFGIAIFLGFWH